MKILPYLVVGALGLGGLTVRAETARSTGKPPTPSTEQREKMAAAHEKMATCLRSERDFSECRNEMMKECGEVFGKAGCPSMGAGMGMGKGPHRGRP